MLNPSIYSSVLRNSGHLSSSRRYQQSNNGNWFYQLAHFKFWNILLATFVLIMVQESVSSQQSMEREISKNSYIAIGPKQIRPGATYDFYIQSLREPSSSNVGPIRAELIIEKQQLIRSGDVNKPNTSTADVDRVLVLAQATANQISGVQPYKISFQIPTQFPLSSGEAVKYPSVNSVALRLFTTTSNEPIRVTGIPPSRNAPSIIRPPRPRPLPPASNRRNQTQLFVNTKRRAIFIQLDKPKYKPGDKVQFRILVVDVNLKPVSGNIHIFITDPKDNRVKQLLDQQLIGGMVTASFQLVERAVLGSWSVGVLFGANESADNKTSDGPNSAVSIATATPESSKSFQVAEYVLPTFEVTLNTPPWGIMERKPALIPNASKEEIQSITVRVIGNFEPKYTFGGTVQGKATIMLKDTYGRYDTKTNKYITESLKQVIETSTDEKAKYAFDLTLVFKQPEISGKELENLISSFNYGRRFEVSLDFEDTQTLKKISKTNSLQIYNFPLFLSVQGPTYFKPGLPYPIQITVQQADGTPLPIKNEFLLQQYPLLTGPNGKIRAPYNPVQIQLKRTIYYEEPYLIPQNIIPSFFGPSNTNRNVNTSRRTEYSIPTLVETDNITIDLNSQSGPSTVSCSVNNSPFTETNSANCFTHTFVSQHDKDGISQKVSRIEFEATIIGQTRTSTFSATKFVEPANVFLELQDSRPQNQANSPLQLGASHKIRAVSTGPIPFLTVVFIARGRIYAIKTYTNMEKSSSNGNIQNKIEITFPIEAGLAPTFMVLAYSVTGTAEPGKERTVIADKLSFRVNQFSANFVNLSFVPGTGVKPLTTNFDKNGNNNIGESLLTLGPRQQAVLNLKTSPQARLGIVAVDKSVQLLGTSNGADNDISRSVIESELESFSGSSNDNVFYGRRDYRNYANTAEIFDKSNLFVLTDANIYSPIEDNIYPVLEFADFARPMAMAAFSRARAPAFGMEMDSVRNLAGPAPPPSARSGSEAAGLPEIETRTEFPETWIWDDVNADSNGMASVTKQTPDTITTWIASALSLDQVNGLGISSIPGQIRVFQPFFVTLNLPYSVIRRERVRIQAIIFNYLGRDVKTLVTLSGPQSTTEPEFEVIASSDSNANSQNNLNRNVENSINIPDSNSQSVFFWIRPLKVGPCKIKVTARILNQNGGNADNIIGDAIEKVLPVKAEGETQYFNKPFLVSLGKNNSGDESSTFTQKVLIDWNAQDFVPGSNFLDVCSIGDIMGPSLANIGNLIRLPYGCGEQNMLTFAPNLFIWAYLTAKGLNTPDLRAKIVDFTEQGFQRQLTFQRPDGSFSAFGENDARGSIWLTSLVLRSFALASGRPGGLGLIFVQERIINNALTFILDNQVLAGKPAYLLGSFAEIGTVHNKALQGGSSKGNFALTCYVYIALRRIANNFINDNNVNVKSSETQTEDMRNRVLRALILSERFLLNSLDGTTNATEISNYDLAIGYFALTLAVQNPINQNALNVIIKQWEEQEKKLAVQPEATEINDLENIPPSPSFERTNPLFDNNNGVTSSNVETRISVPIPSILPIPVKPLPNDNFTYNVRNKDIIALLRTINVPEQNQRIVNAQNNIWTILTQRQIESDQGNFWPAFPQSQRLDVFGPNMPSRDSPVTRSRINPPPLNSWDFETTAYVLLALASQRRLDDGLRPLRWLISQRNSLGGFASTQDTIVALDGLAAFAKLLPPPSQQNMDVTFSGQTLFHDSHLDVRSLLLLDCQTFGSKREPQIDIQARGTGSALLQVSWGYNVVSNTSITPFVLEVRTRRQINSTTLTVNICFSFKSLSTVGARSNMVILEVNAPSGYIINRRSGQNRNDEFNVNENENNEVEKMRDFTQGDTKLTIYYDSVGPERQSINTLSFEQIQMVEDLRPALVRISDYYQPGLRAIGFIEIPRV